MPHNSAEDAHATGNRNITKLNNRQGTLFGFPPLMALQEQ